MEKPKSNLWSQLGILVIAAQVLLVILLAMHPQIIVSLVHVLGIFWGLAVKLWCSMPTVFQKLPITIFLFLLSVRLSSPEYNHEVEDHHNHNETMKGWILLHRRRKMHHEKTMLALRTSAALLCFGIAVFWGLVVEVLRCPKEVIEASGFLLACLGFTFKKFIYETGCRVFMQVSASHHERIEVGQPHVFEEWAELPGGKTVVKPSDWEIVERGLVTVAFRHIELEEDTDRIIEEYMNKSYSELLFNNRKYYLPKLSRIASRPAMEKQARTMRAQLGKVLFKAKKEDELVSLAAMESDAVLAADTAGGCDPGEDFDVCTLQEQDIKKRCKKDIEKDRWQYCLLPKPILESSCNGECAAKRSKLSEKLKTDADDDDQPILVVRTSEEDDDDDEDPMDGFFGS